MLNPMSLQLFFRSLSLSISPQGMPNYGASPGYPGAPHHYSSAGQYHLYGGSSQSPMPGTAGHLSLMQQQNIAAHRFTPPAGSTSSSSSGGRPDAGNSGMAEGSSYMVSRGIMRHMPSLDT